MKTTSSCTQGGKVRKTIKREDKRFTIVECCLGKRTCVCPGQWPELLDFVSRSLKKNDDIRNRYFCMTSVRDAEEKLKPSYFAVLLAVTDEGTIASACWLARDLVRVKGIGKDPILSKTNMVDAGFVTAPEFRRLGLVTGLAEEAVNWLKERFAGTDLEVRTQGSNIAMKMAMEKLGKVRWDEEEECFVVNVTLRQPSLVDARVAYGAVTLGFLLTLWMAPLVSAVARLDRILARRAA